MTAYALLALLYLLWACIAAIAVKSAVELVRELVSGRPAEVENCWRRLGLNKDEQSAIEELIASTELQPRTGKSS